MSFKPSGGASGGSGVTGIAVGSGLTGSANPIIATGTLSVAADGGLPSQTGNSGKFLTSNGTVSSWGVAGTGSVTSITIGSGLTGSSNPITGTGTISLTTTAPTVTAWTAYTATVAGCGTVTNLNVKSRRVGDSLEIMGGFTMGTPSGNASITIGYNGTDSNVTTASGIFQYTPKGSWCVNANRTTASFMLITASSQVSYFTLGLTGAAAGGSIQAISANAGENVSFHIEGIPINGWTVNN